MSASGQPAPPLEFRAVTKVFRANFWSRPVVSVENLDLTVRSGEILGLLGPNGAGKTTTIRLALGLIFPDHGTVQLAGRPAASPAARARVGYLPEVPSYPDDLTGRELVEFAGELFGLATAERRRRAAELLERVGLAHAADRKLRHYSKGMQQRAGMARALVASPEFVILDEPMSGLDPLGRREFRDLILALRTAGTTVLFSSHVLADAEMLCDRVAILSHGRLIALRDIGALAAERPIRRWEAEVTGGGVIAGAELVSVRGDQQLLRFPAERTAEEILAAIRAAGAQVQSLVPQRATLEDLFVETVAGEVAR